MKEQKPKTPPLDPPTLEPMGNYWWVLIVVLLAWAGIGFFPWYMNVSYGGKDWEWGLDRPGVFGDSFGFVNALFSGLALAGVIVAIFLQRKELYEQRKQLYHQYIEVAQSVETQRESQRALASQASFNLIAEVLNLAQYYANNNQFDADYEQTLSDPTPGKERIYKSVTRDLTRATHEYVVESLEELDGFSIPASFRELPYDLFLQDQLRAYYDCVGAQYSDQQTKYETLCRAVEGLSHSLVWEHPRVSDDLNKSVSVKIRQLQDEFEKWEPSVEDRIKKIEEEFSEEVGRLNGILGENKIQDLA